MDDLISRQAAIDRATKEHDFFRGAVTVSDKARRDELLNVMCWLGELPPAQPEIICCGDCKYQDENWRRVSVRWLPCMEVRTGSNWYCGSAERRTDE